MSTLFDVLEWAKQNGEVKIIDRIRVQVLPVTMKEGIALNDVTKDTACSAECLDAVRKAASEIVGQPCPH